MPQNPLEASERARLAAIQMSRLAAASDGERIFVSVPGVDGLQSVPTGLQERNYGEVGISVDANTATISFPSQQSPVTDLTIESIFGEKLSQKIRQHVGNGRLRGNEIMTLQSESHEDLTLRETLIKHGDALSTGAQSPIADAFSWAQRRVQYLENGPSAEEVGGATIDGVALPFKSKTAGSEFHKGGISFPAAGDFGGM